MAQIDPDLLRSPHIDADENRRIRWGIGGLVLIAIVPAVVVVVVLSTGGDPDEGTEAGATTTSGASAIVLDAYAPDPPLLVHPRVLPVAWEACSVTEDPFDPDRFCGPTENQWLEVEYMFPRPPDPETAVFAGLHNGEWVSESDLLEVRFPINEHVAVAVRAQGVDADSVLAIGDSIPLVSDRESLYGAYELPIDWESMTGDDLVGLLDQFERDATVDLGRFELTVRTSNATLYGFNPRSFWTPDAAMDLPMARLVDADRPLVVGESEELRKGYAVWDQAGFAWRLEGNLDADETTALVLSVIAKLADLPIDLTR